MKFELEIYHVAKCFEDEFQLNLSPRIVIGKPIK